MLRYLKGVLERTNLKREQPYVSTIKHIIGFIKMSDL